MPINSKEKGKRGELEIAELLRSYGYDGRRGVQYSGGPDSPYVLGMPGVHIEVKRVEKLNVHDAMKQAERDSGEKIPVVIHRKNRTPWLVTMNFDDFMKIYGGKKNGKDC